MGEPSFDAVALVVLNYWAKAYTGDTGKTLQPAETEAFGPGILLMFQAGLQIMHYQPDAGRAILVAMERFDATDMGQSLEEVIRFDREEAQVLVDAIVVLDRSVGAANAEPLPVAKDAKPCRSCGAMIVFRQTNSGKLAPFNVDPKTGTETRDSHFGTCPDAKRWSRKPAGGSRHGGKERGR